MFTCKNGEDVYLFICYLVNFEKIQWIGSKTTYENLIELLKNEITIRKAFLNVTNEKIVIEYNGEKVDYSVKKANDIPEKMLPTSGEYMDAEDGEFDKEILEFKKRRM